VLFIIEYGHGNGTGISTGTGTGTGTFIPVNATKAYRGRKRVIPLMLNFALGTAEWSLSRPGRLNLGTH
jgi:hypothetical protein